MNRTRQPGRATYRPGVTMEQMMGLGLAWLVMLVGVVGSVVPAIPSTTLVLLAAVLHRLYFGAAGPGGWALVFMGLVMIFSLVLDYLATMIGAKKLGATWRGVVGSVVGALAGAMIGFIFLGIFLGTFLGAVLFEMVGGRKLDEATRAGLGALLGLLGGAIGKLACSVAMVTVFTLSVLGNSFTAPPATPLPSPAPPPAQGPTNAPAIP